MNSLTRSLFGVLLLCATSIAAQESGQRLLSTADLARKVHALQGPGGDFSTDPQTLNQVMSRMRGLVQAFIIRQIEAYPSISACELQRQLAAAFSFEVKLCNDGDESDGGAPRVFADSWGPKSTRRVFAVTYGWFDFYGNNGSQTILESYVWERGRGVHLGSGLVPATFNGFITNSEEVCWFPQADKYWILVWGSVGGGSGRVINGLASVFEISVSKIRTIWNAPPMIGNLKAYVLPGSELWEIDYDDVNRVYDTLPDPSFLDVYKVDFLKENFHRLIHAAYSR